MATTNTFQQAPICDTDANFRLWGKALSDAFAAVGLVKDTDVSQINWTTVAKPTGTSTMMGYEIWRFDDSLQTACPVYFKIQYGSGSASANYPGLILQVGQGSTNTGTLTGTLATASTFGSGTSSATKYSCFVSSDKGRINVAMFTGSGVTIPFAFYIERSKDDTGANTSLGVNIVVFGTSGSSTGVVTQQYLPAIGAAYPVTPMISFMCAMPASGAGSYGGYVGLYPIYPNLGYAANPDMGALVYFTGDIASPGAAIIVSLYGTNHTFITLGVTSPSGSALNGNTTSHSLAVRYE